MDPEEFGVYATALSVGALLGTIVWCGIPASLGRFYIDYGDDEKRFREFFTSNFLAGLGIGGVLLSAIYLYGESVWNGLNSGRIPFSPYIELSVIIAFLGYGVKSLIPVYRMKRNAGFITILQLGPFIIGILIALWYVGIKGLEAEGRLYGEVGAAAVGLVIAIFLVIRRWGVWRINLDDIRAGIAFGLPLLPHTASLWILNFSNRLLIVKYGSTVEAGLFALAVQLALVLTVFQNALNNAWSPVFMQAMKCREELDPIPKILTYSSMWVSVMGFLTCAVILFAKEIVSIVSSSQYSNAEYYIAPVVLAYYFLGLYFPAVNLLIYHKKHRSMPLLTGVVAIINIILNVILISKYGAVMAAYVSLISYALLCLLVHLAANKVEKIGYPYKKYVVVIITVALAMVIINTVGDFPILGKFVYLVSYTGIVYFLFTDEFKKLKTYL